MKEINAILLLYHHAYKENASTIMEHISAFSRFSAFDVFERNTLYGFPSYLNKFEFTIIVLHYSLFGLPICLDKHYREYLKTCRNSYKVAFLQDEYRYWPERSEFLNETKVDCVYTLLEPEFFDVTYRKKTNVKKMFYNLPGYVSREIEQLSKKFYKPEEERSIDIGYRGRRLPYYLGLGSQEKHIIGVEFKKRAIELDLLVDIETEEEERIYGDSWPKFIANCRAVLGVEAGVSVFDIDNQVRPLYAEMVKGHPDVSFPDMSLGEVHKRLLKQHEDKIYYRTISPRHFEAAALKVCQILFEGKYSGIMKPMKHYIPLRKDFSNFDTVINFYRDSTLRQQIAENAFNDLIKSKKYTYEVLIENLDKNLFEQGIQPGLSTESRDTLESEMKHYRTLYRIRKIRQEVRQQWIKLRSAQFPGRRIIRPIIKPIVTKLGI
jgi:hypothetical protein